MPHIDLRIRLIERQTGLERTLSQELSAELVDLIGELIDLLLDLQHLGVLKRKNALLLVKGSPDNFVSLGRHLLHQQNLVIAHRNTVLLKQLNALTKWIEQALDGVHCQLHVADVSHRLIEELLACLPTGGCGTLLETFTELVDERSCGLNTGTGPLV